ncbi:MAG: hypothetical protein VSS75_025170 [Candidatus Parabeggiatoa sp.]|nr:hypothetical protein [Candidatus Parabeggiatoa sp.]
MRYKFAGLENWISIPIKSGLLFWMGGLIAYLYDAELISWDNFRTLDLSADELTLSILAFLLITAMGFSIMNRFSLSLLRLLEGYWFNCLKKPLGVIEKRRCQKIDKRFQQLAIKYTRNVQDMTADELAEYNQIYHEKMSIPDDSAQRMPTRLGNLLRSVESRPYKKYGLNSVVCWPRLWPLLPEAMKTEVTTARENLETAVHSWMWSLLFIIWGIFTAWAIIIGVVLTLLTYRLLLNAAEIYGQLVETSFDLYRFSLYEALHWPPPSSPDEEYEKGCQLSDYLYKGVFPENPSICFLKKETNT